MALAGCMTDGGPPDRAGGVGFGDYQDYLARREAALQGGAAAPMPMAPDGTQPAPPAALDSPASGVIPEAGEGWGQLATGDDLNRAGWSEAAEIGAEALSVLGAAPVTTPAASAPPPAPAPAAAVTSHPEAGPNLAAYALAAPNRLGEPAYRRGGLKLMSHERSCARYASSDQAQRDFLERGGPARDPRNLDPDGDGFACAWDPTPFQSVRN